MSYTDRSPDIVAFVKAGDTDSLARLAIELNGMLLGRHKARQPTVPREATGWVGRLGDLWRAQVGAVSYPRFGKALKQLVEDHGEDEVRRALERYIREETRAKSVEWFAAAFHRWRQPRYTVPLVQGGWLSDEFERATRP